ncbi:Sporulation thiol-disulfide oxidoreductase [Lentibacillus sp. JNUCC-1]|nr:Sporulation thiol-disulfide oxidoreductase [Lentibacillus sp. JNUCC-1]
MEKLHNEKDVQILAVNLTQTENNRENVENFVDEYGLTFKILMDEETTVANKYQIQPIPTTFLIDSNGLIHRKAMGALNYEMMVQELDKMD